MPTDPGPTPARRPPRRGPRLGLRASMLLVVAVALPFGWAANTIRAQRRAIAAVRAAGGTIEFDWTRERDPGAPGGRAFRKEPAAPRWLRRWLGDELFQAVTWVTFSRPVAPEAMPGLMAAVGEFARLESLTLAGVTGLGDGLRHPRGKRRLWMAWLSGPDIGDAMLADLVAVPSLRRLTIGSPSGAARIAPDPPDRSPSDAAFAGLAALRGLQDLTIGHCPNVTDATLAGLVAGLPRLRTFDLDTWPGSPAATVAALARHHPDLRFLGLARTGTTDADLRPAGAFARLMGIRLRSTWVGDVGVAHLRPSEVPATEFAFDDTAITDASLRSLGAMPNLQGLNVSRTRITDAGLTRLRSLAVASNRLTDAALPALDRLTSLERLGLAGNPAVTDGGLAALRPLAGLRSLTVDGTGVTPAGLAALRVALPALRAAPPRPAPASLAAGPPPR